MHKSSVQFGKKKSEVRFGFGKKFLVRSFPNMHTYLSYFPTSLISKFSSPFISYAGLGIYPSISSCAGCNIFSYCKILQKYVCLFYKLCLQLHCFCTWAILYWCPTYTKKVSKEENMVSGSRLFYFGKIKRFVWNGVGIMGWEKSLGFYL